MRRLFDKEIWQEIFSSIQKNKLRTMITIIGVLWGIFLYIVLSGLAKGVDNGFERQFERISSNSLFIWGQSTRIAHNGFQSGRQIKLTLEDIAILKKRIPEIKHIVPRNVTGVFGSLAGNVVYGQRNGSYNIYGDYPVFIKVATKDVYTGGRFINEQDIKKERKVCVIGERTQKELFNAKENPIGKFISINSVYFKVIGIHKYVQQGGDFANDGDIHIPFTTYKKLFNTGEEVDFLIIAGFEDVNIINVENQVKKLLKTIHNVSPEDQEAINGFNLGDVFNKISRFSYGMSFLSIIIGIATIIAGVIGIGNILLISVKERTKEIGIRRAIGATPKEIKLQIILESVFLTIIAGVIGIIMGAFILFTVDQATKNITDYPFTNPTVPIEYIAGALILMIFLGVLIGLIPAKKAVSIKPIDALREE